MNINKIKQYLVQSYDLDDSYDIKLLVNVNNTVFKVANEFKHYIFRIYAIEKKVDEIKSEIELLCFLSDHEINIEYPISNNKNQYYEKIQHQEYIRCCGLYKGLDGIINDSLLSHKQARNLGQALGKFHSLTDIYNGQNSFRVFDCKELVYKPWQIIKPNVKYDDKIYDFYKSVIKRCERELKANESYFSWGICHGDFHAGNIVFDQNNNPGIFDFELCCISWRIYDLATFVWSVLPREDYSKETIELINRCIKSFIEGYQNEVSLKLEEVELIYYIALLRHIWRQADRIQLEKSNVRWKSKQHFMQQKNRMEKWIEIYEIK